MPILNVHHKLYIIDREIWEYDDDDLITLCQKCHQTLHSSEEIEIPIVKEITKGRFVKTDKCTAKPAIQTFNPMQIETFPSWSVVEKRNHKYEFVEKLSLLALSYILKILASIKSSLKICHRNIERFYPKQASIYIQEWNANHYLINIKYFLT